MATAFKQVKNNAQSLVATAPSPATSGTSLIVTASDGTKFPSPGNSFWCTIWNATTYAEPGLDPNQEIVLVTARSTDTFTITRVQQSTAARTVVIGDAIRLLWTAQNAADIHTAINTLEAISIPKYSFDAVVASSGGDYTTVAAALAGGARSIYVKNGTYTEGTLNTAWTGTKPIFIMGESKGGTILQLASTSTGYLNINIAESSIQNIQIKPGAASLGSATNGWININGVADCSLINVHVVGQNNASYANGPSLYLQTNAHRFTIRDCYFENESLPGAIILADINNLVIAGTKFSGSKGAFITPTNNCYKAHITHNSFLSSGTTRTAAAIDAVTTNTWTESFICHNSFALSNSDSGGNYAAVRLYGTISNNDISNNIFILGGDYAQAITGSTAAKYTRINYNTVQKSGAFVQGGIIECAADYCSVVGNIINYSGSNVSIHVGILVSGGTGTIIDQNIVIGLAGTSNQAYNFTGSTTPIFGINQAFNCTTTFLGSTLTSKVTPDLVRTVTTTYAVLESDNTILCDATSAAFTVTLPTCTDHSGLSYNLKKTDATANAVTIATTSSQTIDGATTFLLTGQWQSVNLVCNGTSWFIR